MNDEIQTPPCREIPRDRLLLRKELLMQDIALMEQPRSEDPKQSPRRRRVVTALLVPAALLTAGGAYAITHAPASATVEGIVCFEDASGNSGGSVVGADGRQPGEVCAQMWEAGNIVPNVSEAPPLQACTLPKAHYVGVYPSGDPNLCALLGLAPVPVGYEEAAARFSAMRDDLAQHLNSACVDGQEATRIARETLDRHGFDEWNIEAVGPWSWKDPCSTSYYLNAVRRVVYLFGEPGPEV